MQVQVTRSVAASHAATRPEFAEILERVRKLRPDIEARALAAEKAKRVPAETMEALRDADVFRLMQPQRFGGYEYGPAELAQIGFELGRACGSTGWCGTLAVCFGWMTAFFPLEAQQEVWDNPDNLLAVSYTPSPHVEQVDGGYKISGSWPWASGVDSAAWLILSALLPTQGGPPTLAWCLVPVGAVTIDHDSWNVSGLQGTGSKTVKISDPLFVPKHRVLPISAIFSGKVPGLDVPGNDQARFGYPTFGPTALVAPIVGMAQGALDAFTQTARGARRMARPGVFEKVAESALIQSLIGQAAARIDAAQTLMLISLREGEDIVRAGGTLEIEQRVRIRRNHGFAARTSAEVVNEIFFKSGASAADETNRVQRFWRDANTAALHSSIDWDALSALYGMQQLGLQPQGIF
ncbi:MAG: acyl-CoA dehydrogenase family protein [Xanthobacteraceae bacterium]|jgi:resorcinol 4-hydroxylase (FADH2)